MPPGAPLAAAAPPTIPSMVGVPSTVPDKLMHLGAYAAQNGAVVAAPFLSTINPSVNPDGVGGPEVALLAMWLNVVAQPIKMIKWFDQDKYLPWVLIGIALLIALLIWRDNIAKAVLNAGAGVYTAMENYGHLNKLSVMASGPPTAKDVALAAATGLEPEVVAAA